MRINAINSQYSRTSNHLSFQKKNLFMDNQIVKKALFIPTLTFLTMLPNVKANSSSLNDTNKWKVETVQYTQDFKFNNKEYTMMYLDNGFNEIIGENAVADIYFLPKDKKDKTLKLEHLFLHKLENNENVYIGVVSEVNTDKNSPQKPPQEIKFPKEIGESLLKLYEGKTEYFLIPGSNTYTEY